MSHKGLFVRTGTAGGKMQRRRLSIVAPAYNEVESIESFVAEVLSVLDSLEYETTLLVVDDGSTDGTGPLLDELHERHPKRIGVLHLSRNFGHQAALTAGMDYANGDAVICLDADLQHPPSLIPAMVERWEQGYDLVQAVRRPTPAIGFFKNFTAQLFYLVINLLSSTRIEPNAADFRLMSRRVVDVFRKDLRERDRFLRGLVSWVGFRTCRIEFDPAPRAAGETKYSFKKMLDFARAGLISFSKIPLKIAVLFSLAVSTIALVCGVYALLAYFFFGHSVQPWTAAIIMIAFLGGCQMLFLGVIAEYIATIFDEIKGRPLYIVADVQMTRAEKRSDSRSDMTAIGRAPAEYERELAALATEAPDRVPTTRSRQGSRRSPAQ